MSDDPAHTKFLHDPLGVLYAKTALPIVFVMSMNGLLAIVDAMFLGAFVGPEALAAVTLMFPAFMITVSLATLVSGGMSSLLARRLGAGETEDARAVFTGAHGLCLTLGALLIGLFFLLGRPGALLIAGGAQELADMGLIYLRITILFSPFMFILSIHSDALRNEGRVGFMAAVSLLVSLANMAFNYLLIAHLQMGVAGSAYGTALAQSLALAILLSYRLSGRSVLPVTTLLRYRLTSSWSRILALGAPQSLNFLGLALGSTSTLIALQWVEAPNYEATVSAFGIMTRVMTFAFLPLLGLSFAMQTITGSNFGARDWARSDRSLTVALVISVLYCATIQLCFTLFAPAIGGLFVDSPQVIAEFARILPIIVTLMVLTGPHLMLTTYFQAIGDATRAALLGLSKPYAFSIPLTFLLAAWVGEVGIWYSGPVGEALLFGLVVLILTQRRQRMGGRFGLYQSGAVGS